MRPLGVPDSYPAYSASGGDGGSVYVLQRSKASRRNSGLPQAIGKVVCNTPKIRIKAIMKRL